MMDILATIQAQLKAPKDKTNEFGKYQYRNCESILRAFKEVCPEDVSLTMSDAIFLVGDRLFLVATTRLYCGEKCIGTTTGAAMHALQKKGMDDAQITGACSSYARKYALCGLFAIDDSTADPDSKDNSRFDAKAAEDRIAASVASKSTEADLVDLWRAESDTVDEIGGDGRARIVAAFTARKAAIHQGNQS